MAVNDLGSQFLGEKRQNPAEELLNVYQGRLPKDIKDVFRVAKALVVGNEIISPVIGKMAETPITNIVVKTKGEHPDPKAEEQLKKIMVEKLKIRDHLNTCSFNMFGYSNAFSSVYFAPKRYLVCPTCADNKKRKKGEKYKWLASKIEWRMKTRNNRSYQNNTSMVDVDFYGDCPNGHKGVKFKRQDIVFHNTKSLRIILWDPFHIDIVHYRAIGRNEYYYKFDKEERARVSSGDRVILCEYPWPYVLACLNNRTLHIRQSGFWHFKLSSVSGVYDGWGTPKILSILTALYTVMSIMKANESISEGRINDLTIISPSPNRGGTADEDPIGSIGLSSWLSQTKSIIEKFKKDKTLTAFLPFPVTSESVYGQGRLQLVTGELSLYIRNIVAALGLPDDVVFSGGNYTSIAVAARILANQAETARKNYNNFLNFVKDTISRSLTDADFSNLTVELQPYESSDDFQKTNLMIQIALSGRFPWGPIYKRFGFNLDDIKTQLNEEATIFGELLKKTSEFEGRSSSNVGAIQQYFQMQLASEMAKWNALQQNADLTKAEEGGADPKKMDMAAQSLAQNIVSGYPPDMWSVILQDIRGRDPELAKLVEGYIDEYKDGAGASPEPMQSTPPNVQQTQPMIGGGSQQQLSAVKQIGQNSSMPDKLPPRSSSKL